jgi:adenylate cyclase
VTESGVIVVVDDVPQNIRLLEAVLASRGYTVVPAASGEEALGRIAAGPADLVLLDIVMPGLDGYEVCRRLRADPATSFLPVVMVTASGEQEKTKAIEAGADDFIAKPIDQAELLARVRSLLRIKRYRDTIEAYNRQLRRFLAPAVAELVSAGDLETHRREISVVVFDLPGFSAFAETAEPEDAMAVLGEHHEALGELVREFEGTLARFTGAGAVVLFNDPLPCPDAPARAVRLAVAMRSRVWELAERWSRLGADLQLGAGIAQGHATLGVIGFEGRSEYAAVGSVTTLAERLCEHAEPGQILISARVFGALEDVVVAQPLGELALRGLARPAPAYDVAGID